VSVDSAPPEVSAVSFFFFDETVGLTMPTEGDARRAARAPRMVVYLCANNDSVRSTSRSLLESDATSTL